MKILLTARTFLPPFSGGVDVYALRLGRALSRLGHEVAFVAVDSTKTGGGAAIELASERLEGFPVWRLGFEYSRRPKAALDAGYDPEMGAAFRRVLDAAGPDLVVILNFYLLSFTAVEAVRERGIPLAHIATDFVPICRRATLIRWDGSPCVKGESVRNCSECFVSQRKPGRLAAAGLGRIFSEKQLVRLAGRRYRMPHPLAAFRPYWEQVALNARRIETLGPLRREIDLVVTPTRFTQEMFLAGGFDPGRVICLPFAVEDQPEFEPPARTPADVTRFLFIGRLQPYKGAHVLVEAFNRLENPRGATLTIYGRQDGYESYFKRLQASIASNDRIRFPGSIPPEALSGAFREADYFLLPSTWHENNPLILFDALQSNTPVIASDIGGVRDFIRDGENGFLFPMGDADALQRVLQRVIDAPELAGCMQPGADLIRIDDYARTLLDELSQRTRAK